MPGVERTFMQLRKIFKSNYEILQWWEPAAYRLACWKQLLLNQKTSSETKKTQQSRKPAVFFPRADGNCGGKRKCEGSGNMCKVFVPSAGVLAEPMRFEKVNYSLSHTVNIRITAPKKIITFHLGA